MKSRHRKQSGFTLIEILVVIFIISIVTSVALLTISRNENRQLESFAKELAQRITLAEEQAMLQPSVLGLSIKEHGYHFANLDSAQGEKKAGWRELEDKLLAKHAIPADMELRLEMGGEQVEIAEHENNEHTPQIVISTNGDITPFTIYIGKKGKSPRYVINGNTDGNITSKTIG